MFIKHLAKKKLETVTLMYYTVYMGSMETKKALLKKIKVKKAVSVTPFVLPMLTAFFIYGSNNE